MNLRQATALVVSGLLLGVLFVDRAAVAGSSDMVVAKVSAAHHRTSKALTSNIRHDQAMHKKKPVSIAKKRSVVSSESVRSTANAKNANPSTQRSTGTFVSTASAKRPFFGIDVPRGDLSTIPSITQAAGERPSVFNIFVKLDSPFPTSKITNIAAAGLVPEITLEPWSWKTSGPNQPQYSLASIFDGSHDADFARIAGVIAQSGTPIYLRFAHEMNGTWYPWAESVNGNKPGDYVKAWTHVHNLFAAAGATKVTWVWSPNINIGSRGTPLAEVMPSQSSFDMAGISCYGHSGTALSTCGPTLRELVSLTSKPIVLSEVGADGAAKASWISSLTSLFQAYPQIAGFVWFNTSPQTTGASGYYEFTDNTTDIAAFRNMLAAR